MTDIHRGWTPEREDRLKQLVEANVSASAIAAEFGLGRGAVTGKAARLGLRLTGGAGGGSTHGRTPLPRRPRQGPIPSLPAALVENPKRVTFAKLNWHHCRFPYGDPGTQDFFFCGATKERGAYCAYHAAIAYQRGTK